MSSPPQTLQSVFDNAKIVRRAQVADIPVVMYLAKEIPTMAQWSRANFETYCATEQQAETHTKTLFVASVTPRQNPISSRKHIVGFAAFSAIPQAGGGECELENMAVAELWRRQGIARQLLAMGLLWCRAWCPPDGHGAPPSTCLSLEVRAANLSAIAFYESAGFAACGRRPGYYAQPDDDAIVMWKSLDASLSTC